MPPPPVPAKPQRVTRDDVQRQIARLQHERDGLDALVEARSNLKPHPKHPGFLKLIEERDEARRKSASLTERVRRLIIGLDAGVYN